MIINTVKIRGFKIIKKAEMELSPGTNLFLGHNGAGKSSFLEAIEYALTDSVLGQQKKNLPEIINDQVASTSVMIAGKTEKEPFAIKRSLAKTNRSGPSPVQVGAQLGVDPTILSACLNANHYFGLPPADQKKLLTKALGLVPTKDDVLQEFEDRGYADNPQEKAWNEEIIDAIDTFGDWDSGYKKTYGLRREAGQETKVLEGNRPKLIEEVFMGDQNIPMAMIIATHEKEPLEKQEETYKTSLKEFYAELGGIKALSESETDKIKADREEYRAEKVELAGKPKWTKNDTTKATELKKARAAFDTKIKKDVAALESLTEIAEGLLTKNKKEWKSDLKCPVPGESGHVMCPAIEPDWSEQQNGIDKLEKRIETIEEKEFPEQEKWNELSDKAVECKDNKTRDGFLNKSIDELTRKLENAKPGMVKKKEKLETSIADLETKVDHLRLAQSAIIQNQSTQETLDQTQVQIDKAEAKHSHYDELCRVLAPGGIPGELVAEKLEVLNERLKCHAEMMGVEVVFNESLELMQFDGKQLWTMGGSETARVKMAVAEALSYVSGIRLVLLDEANISVFDAAIRVRKWFAKIAAEGIQTIVAAATNSESPPSIKKGSPAAIKVFWVEAGSFKELGN